MSYVRCECIYWSENKGYLGQEGLEMIGRILHVRVWTKWCGVRDIRYSNRLVYMQGHRQSVSPRCQLESLCKDRIIPKSRQY